MRAPLATALIFLSLLGSAKAGTITKVGAVEALTDINQMMGIVGTATFDEGPMSGDVPLNQYTPEGLTWQTGPLSAILAGVATPGTAYQPIYYTSGSFPLPILGGGTHEGQSSAFAGVATFSGTISQVGLTASANDAQYLTVWSKSGTMIGQVSWVPGGTASWLGVDTLGVPIGMVAFGNDDLWNGATYDAVGPTNVSDTWVWGGGCGSDAQCDDSNPCTDDICDAVGACTYTSNALPCDDGDPCTQTDTCQAGACAAGNPVVCAPLDTCHDAGVCDQATGICDDPPKPEGFACDDGDACTQTDTCQSGVCTGSTPVACAAMDECHDVGMCDAMAGTCSNPAKPDGSPCAGGTCVHGSCIQSSGSIGAGGAAGAGGAGGDGAGGDGTGGLEIGGCGCDVQSSGQGSSVGTGFLLLLALRRRSRTKIVIRACARTISTSRGDDATHAREGEGADVVRGRRDARRRRVARRD